MSFETDFRRPSGVTLRTPCISGSAIVEKAKEQRRARTALIARAFDQKRPGETMADAIARLEHAGRTSARAGVNWTPERRAAQSARVRARHANPEFRAAWCARMGDPDVRAKLSASHRGKTGRPVSPEAREKLAACQRERMADPARRERIRQAQIAAWARKRAAKQPNARDVATAPA